jgi:hypothetical protein
MPVASKEQAPARCSRSWQALVIARRAGRVLWIVALAPPVGVPAVSDGKHSHETVILVELIDDPIRATAG